MHTFECVSEISQAYHIFILSKICSFISYEIPIVFFNKTDTKDKLKIWDILDIFHDFELFLALYQMR